jgi:hypothetical protein
VQQLDIAQEIARRQAEEGMRRSLEHAEAECEGWGDRALAYLRHYAENHDRFPGWFATQAAELTGSVPAPPTRKAWGAIFIKAARLGWIRKDGYTPDIHRKSNPCPVWASKVYRA